VDDHEKESIGAMVGGGVGAATGAKIGTVLIPVPIVGPFVGGVLGAAAGTAVGRRAGRALLDGAIAFVETVRDDLEGLDLPAAPILQGLLRPTPPAIEAGGEPV
jgi:phage tail tape-measure protein